MREASVGTQRDLASLLDVRQVDDESWEGASDTLLLPQMFGGQLVGQTVVAASRSIGPDAELHAVHTLFLRGGVVGEPVRYAVRSLTSGRTRHTRQVEAWQGDRLVCSSLVSALTDQDGFSHARPAPAAAQPEESVPLADLAVADGGLGLFWDGFEAIEVRVSTSGNDVDAPHSAAPPTNIWMRAGQRLPDDPALHQGALAYASDLMLMGSVLTVHGVPIGHERTLADDWWGVSLDHSLWFHERARGDDWLLYEHATPMATGSRALIQAAVFDRGGRPVCQVSQEALIRRAR